MLAFYLVWLYNLYIKTSLTFYFRFMRGVGRVNIKQLTIFTCYNLCVGMRFRFIGGVSLFLSILRINP